MKMFCISCGASKEDTVTGPPLSYCACGSSRWTNDLSFSQALHGPYIPSADDHLRAKLQRAERIIRQAIKLEESGDASQIEVAQWLAYAMAFLEGKQ